LDVPCDVPLDLGHSFRCGQIFRWRENGGAWVGTLGDAALAITRERDALRVVGSGAPPTPGELQAFLGLDHDLAHVRERIATDTVMARAIAALPGLRLLRQEPWECLITYIASAWNNIPKIDRSVQRIAERWGRTRELPTPAGTVPVTAFPEPSLLAAATEAELRECGLGYRAPLVLAAARRIAGGELDLRGLRALPYPEALAALLRLPGVGRKVADCILLFSLEKGEAFPVDVWVRRLIHEHYPDAVGPGGSDPATLSGSGPGSREINQIQAFAWERWGRFAGYAQQYLFTARRFGLL
jgi:N-glycosylase/DNA lyase